MPVNNLYYNKYLKYKNKYLNLQSQIGGDVKPHPDTSPLLPLRQKSEFISNQGNYGTCFAHGTTRLIMKLITTFFNDPSLLGNRDCHYYYNTEICNINNNIFDCFLEIKKGELNCQNLPSDNIKLENWPKENFYALLFHFIFSILIEQFSLNGASPLNSCLYILDYLKYIDIKKKDIEEKLKYNTTEYGDEDKKYFDILINKSVELFKDVKKKLNNKIFNPIIYYIVNTSRNNVWSISEYKYHTKHFKCTNNDYYSIKTEEISFIDKLVKKIPFSNKIEQLHPTYTHNHNLKEFTNTTNLEKNIKYVLDHNYYALFSTNNHVIIISGYSGNVDDLILEIKDSHGLECSLDCTWVSNWCKLINKNEIKLNELLKWTKDYWEILFFYPYEFINQENIKKQFNKNKLFKYHKEQISNDEGIAIARVLMQNTTLKTLYMNHCKISDDVIQAIANALEKNNTLTILNLSDNDNNINFDGVKAIANALEKNSTLTILNLSNMFVSKGTEEIGKALEKNSTLRILNLSNNMIGTKGAEEIGKALEKNSTLIILNLSNNKIGNKGAEEIGKALGKNSTLTILVLYNNDIGNYGAKEIVRALEKNSTLTILNLDSNSIKNEGAKAIADALKTNKTLKEIELSYNDIDDDGVKVIAEALKKNKDSAIEIISFNNNLRISSKIIEKLNEKRIFFSQYTDEQKKIINDFERNTTSTKKISEAEGIAIAHALARNTTLLDLFLSYCNITDYVVKAIARALGQNTTLTELVLQGNNIGDDGAIAIGKALKINRTLTFIDLAYNNIEDTGTLAIAEALETNEIIEKVDLAFNKKISSRIKDHVKSLLGLGQEKRILFT
jgi:Ran GTPase-activating protein (RanGAP) involved in mRNA processing and transport